MRQELEFLKNYISRWEEYDLLRGKLLRAIIQLSLDDKENASTGFSCVDIVEAISDINGYQWSSSDDTEKMGNDVRTNWNALIETWDIKKEGIRQYFTDKGYEKVPQLYKTPNKGGAGKLTRHRIDWVLPEESDLATIQHDTVTPPKSNIEAIRYVCEDIQDAGFLAGIFKNGYRLIGWRRTLYISIVALPLLLCLLAVLLYIFETTILSTIDGVSKTTTSGFSLIFGIWMVWLTIGAFYNLADDKIVMSPWWMQSDNTDRLLERRYAPLYPETSINAVRYTSKCPICDGIISVKSGGLEFRNRLIGYCDHSPREHVYSFDHITRKGKYLR